RGALLRAVFVSLKLPPQEIARAALIVIGVAFGCYLLWRVQEVLFLLVLAILLATAIEPVVKRLRRGPFTRGSGVLAVYTLIIVAIGLPAYILVPSVISQAAAFTTTLPDRIDQLRPYAINARPLVVSSLAIS